MSIRVSASSGSGAWRKWNATDDPFTSTNSQSGRSSRAWTPSSGPANRRLEGTEVAVEGDLERSRAAADGREARVGLLRARDGGLAAMGAAAAEDPEDPPGTRVRLGGHDLLDEPAERFDARAGLTASEELGVVNVPGSGVGPGASPLVLVLNEHRVARIRGDRGMAADPDLDARLLVGADGELLRRNGRPSNSPA